MKLPYLLPLLAVAAAHAEEKTDLATADAYRPQYDFSPPPVITPQTPAYWTKKELFWRTLRLLDKKGAIRHPMMRNSPL